MKYVLIFILYTMSPNISPVIGHKVYTSSEKCEQAKYEAEREQLPDGVKGAAICISEAELLNYTRT